MIHSIRRRLNGTKHDVLLFLTAIVLSGFAASMMDSIFNNFLNETFRLSDFQRSALEVPRELPGLLVMFVSAAFYFLCSRRLAAVSMFLAAAGLALVGSLPFSYTHIVAWLFIYSLGQHVFLPLNSSIGMELAQPGKTGKQLGKINALRNVATLTGSFIVLLAFKYLHFRYRTIFYVSALGFVAAGLIFMRMSKGEQHPVKQRLKLHKEYRLYYWINILYGSRKQIFLTFAPWVLVTVFQQPTQTIATLLTYGGVVGILFQPFLGRIIDMRGERFVLAGEAVILIAICLLYGFAGSWFSNNTAFIIVAGCYVIDQLLISVSMARATYLKKIALDPSHVTPTLTAGTSIDHVFSIATAVVSGLIWKTFGYQYVFLLGAGIAVINFFSTLCIVIPTRQASWISKQPVPETSD